uniref:Uncharacterized protein n=1 Tax=Glossina austeni TaxID=7395 RepID=A0A1A9VC11_GLOAU
MSGRTGIKSRKPFSNRIHNPPAVIGNMNTKEFFSKWNLTLANLIRNVKRTCSSSDFSSLLVNKLLIIIFFKPSKDSIRQRAPFPKQNTFTILPRDLRSLCLLRGFSYNFHPNHIQSHGDHFNRPANLFHLQIITYLSYVFVYGSSVGFVLLNQSQYIQLRPDKKYFPFNALSKHISYIE